jgi:hypothetical protein
VNTWHAGEPELADYLAGRSSRPVAASIEAHLLACGDCRATLASVADHRSREDAWARLADTVDRPSSRWLHGHRVVAASVATPAVPLLTATAVGDAGLVTLLVLAPLAPMAAVAVAYREWADPAGEISLATASAGLRLVATRALAVSLVALPVAVVALLAVDLWVEAVPLRLAVAWCLPGLALASLVLLAGTTRLDPMPVALGISAAWTVLVVAVVTVRRTLRPEMFVDLLGSPTTQAVALAVAAAALLLTAARRDAVAYRRIA